MSTSHVCLTCRSVDGRTDEEGRCQDCGEQTKWTPRNWCPPKKNNDRAWKRVQKGEWLWDRRRVHKAVVRYRHRQHLAHIARKNKGVSSKFRGDYKYQLPDVEMGG